MWLPSSPYLPCGRTPGGPPIGACTARAPFGHGRVVRPAPSLRCLPTLPLCPRGGGPRSATVNPPPSGGRWCVGGGGAPLSSSLCSTHVASTTQARRKHRARHLAAVGGGFPLWGPHTPEVGYLTSVSCGPMSPPASPRSSRYWSLPPRFLPLARWFALFFVFFFLHRLPPVSPPGASVCPLPPPMSPRRLLAVLAPFLGGWGRRGWGGGGRPRCPSSGVSTSQARRRHEARHLSLCRGGGGGRAVWLPSSPFLPCVHTPGAPPPLGLARRVLPTGTVVWPVPHPLSAASRPCRFVLRGGGGRCPPLPTSIPHPWGGGGVWGGGGGACRLPFVARMSQARRKHGAGTRRGSCPSAGGGACLVAPVVALSTLRSHPRWSPRWGLHGACSLRARSCGSSRTLSPLPPHPAALSSGGGRFSPPPTRISHPWGGGGVWGGGGRPCRLPFVARTSQARRKHGAGTRRGTCPFAGGGACRVSPVVAPPTLRAHPRGGGSVWGGGGGALVVVPSLHACRRHNASTGWGTWLQRGGGGVSPLGLPALLHGIGSAPQDLQPLLPLGGSRHVSAWCSVSRACSLLCPYLLEEVRTRVETDDEEVRAAGRTYRTPRRLLAPSAALVEGRAPVSAPNSPGGGDCPSSPWCLCFHFRAA